MLRSTAGAPLRAMASLAAIWIVVRIISWNNPGNITPSSTVPVIGGTAHHSLKTRRTRLAATALPRSKEYRQDITAVPGNRSLRAGARYVDVSSIGQHTASKAPGLFDPPWINADEVRRFYLQASFAGPSAVKRNRARPSPRFPNPPTISHDKRVAAYFWIYARQHSGSKQGEPQNERRSIANGQYGGSQAGAILSYRLFDPPSPDISLYGRLSAALAPLSQKEFSFGTRIHPVQSLPIAVHAEQRFAAKSGGNSGTAFYVTGGTGPDQIIEKFELETYAQAGYVLGQNDTYFFDGSMILQRPIGELGSSTLAIGPGVWAGGQRKISRMDIGPRIDWIVPFGSTSARLALDWRVRVAGDATPGNGAAITLAAGF